MMKFSHPEAACRQNTAKNFITRLAQFGAGRNFPASPRRSSQENQSIFPPVEEDLHSRTHRFLISIKRERRDFAIGWTGQWRCTISRDDKQIRVEAGIEDVRFKLYPGEKIRTASILVMPYEGGQDDAHNKFRRLLKRNFSLAGQKGREPEGPLSHMFWGAMTSEKMSEIIQKIYQQNLGFEYIWIDAGWYGDSTQPCLNEFEGDWPNHTGDWSVNPTYHPDGFRDVSRAVLDCGMKFMLWLELTVQ